MQLDAYDEAVYSEAFVLADAVRRFLARRRTQQVIDAELLDDDVVRDLIESADAMAVAREARVLRARGEV